MESKVIELKETESESHVRELLSRQGLSVVFFMAGFHEACAKGGQMDSVFNLLSSLHGTEATFYKVGGVV